MIHSQNGGSDNNLNLLRLFFSFSVLLYHSFELSQSKELSYLSHFFNPDLAVQGFFIISGYLIFKSYGRSPSTIFFYIKRLKRIYPGYITVILFCSVFGSLISTLPFDEYFMSPMVYKYLLANSVFLNFIQQSLPGVFNSHHFEAVNGSLWTLKIEVSFYLIVPLIVFLRKSINTHLLYSTLIIVSLAYYFGTVHLYNATKNDLYLFLSRQLPGQLFFFVIGAWLIEFENYPLFKKTCRIIGLPCIIILYMHPGTLLGGIALAGAIIFIGFIVPTVRYPFSSEDISYGLYIYHFPVIQTFIYFGLLGAHHHMPEIWWKKEKRLLLTLGMENILIMV